MTADFDPDSAVSGGFTDARVGTDSTVTGSTRRTWLHWLFSVGGGRVFVVAAVTSVLYFVAVYLLAVALGWGPAYLNPANQLGLSAYATTLGVFVVLVILGTWVTSYVEVWQAVEPCIAADSETYDAFLEHWTDRLYRTRNVILLFVAFETPFAFVVNELNPFVPFEALLTVLNATIVFLATTAIYLFVVHFFAVRAAMRLGIDNAFTAAQRLGPLARLSINTAVWWFVGVTVLSTYYWLWLSDFLRPLVFRTGVDPAYVPPTLGVVTHAALMGLLITVGFALVAVPTWQMHVALSRAKHDLLTDVNAHFDAIVHDWTDAAAAETVSTELSAAEKAYESVTRIQTWPFDVEAVVKLFVSSVIPLSQFVWTTARSVLGLT
jgi:hypothetical protein